jgi:hypothetical protein
MVVMFGARHLRRATLGQPKMSTVTLRIYDLSMGMAAQMSEPLLGKKIEYIPHT